MSEPILFVFPHAGGNSRSYLPMKAYVKCAEVRFMDRPGFGSRFTEPPLEDLSEVLVDQFDLLRGSLNSPYFFFGHSFGALVAFTLSIRLREAGLPCPQGIFLSGLDAPCHLGSHKRKSEMPREELWKEIFRIGGIDGQFLRSDDLKETFYPRVRAELLAYESFRYGSPARLEIPIALLIGHGDLPGFVGHDQWNRETDFPLRTVFFPGGHFYFMGAWPSFCEALTDLIQATGRGLKPVSR